LEKGIGNSTLFFLRLYFTIEFYGIDKFIPSHLGIIIDIKGHKIFEKLEKIPIGEIFIPSLMADKLVKKIHIETICIMIFKAETLRLQIILKKRKFFLFQSEGVLFGRVFGDRLSRENMRIIYCLFKMFIVVLTLNHILQLIRLHDIRF
jgi:hypothetical protein